MLSGMQLHIILHFCYDFSIIVMHYIYILYFFIGVYMRSMLTAHAVAWLKMYIYNWITYASHKYGMGCIGGFFCGHLQNFEGFMLVFCDDNSFRDCKYESAILVSVIMITFERVSVSFLV